VDSNTFLTQLAQLSEVQGITQLNTSFSTLSSSLSPSQALQASSLLGHKVLVTSTTANLAANGTVTGAVSVPQTTSQVLLDARIRAASWCANQPRGAIDGPHQLLVGR